MTTRDTEPYCQDCGAQVGYVLAEDGQGFTHRPAQLRYGKNPPTVTIVCADCAPAATRKPHAQGGEK